MYTKSFPNFIDFWCIYVKPCYNTCIPYTINPLYLLTNFLQYEIPSNSLFVRIIEARDLPPPYSQDASRQDMAHSNPYAKLCLLPDQKDSQQTSVQRKTQEPTWGEMFKFELPFSEVQRRTLEVTVKDFDKFSRHCVIGQVHFPLEGVNIVKGGHMWKPLMPCHRVSRHNGLYIIKPMCHIIHVMQKGLSMNITYS